MHALDDLHFERTVRQRLCPCGTVLSRYNPNDLCGPCTVKAAAQAEKREFRPKSPAPVPEIRQPEPKPQPRPVPKEIPKEVSKGIEPRFKATQIVNAAGFVFGIEPRDITSGAKGGNAKRARQVAEYLVRVDVSPSFPWIANFFGRHHTTVIHSCERMGHAFQNNTSPKEKIERVRALYPTMSGKMLFSFRRLPTAPLRVLQTVETMFDLAPERLRRKGNMRSIVIPRQILTYLLHEISEQSTVEIGRFLGQDHTTVMHSLRKIKKTIECDPAIREVVERARTLCSPPTENVT